MTRTPAPLLAPEVVKQIRRIAQAIDEGEVAPLVGAGLSSACGLTDWNNLVRRMILAWRERNPTAVSRRLSDDEYVQLFLDVFSGNLGVVSFLRAPGVRRRRTPALGDLVYPALYGDPEGNPCTPAPSQVHRHLVALFAKHPQRIWTTNYDDLIEEAARQAHLTVRTLDPRRHRPGQGLTVAHLHGFLAPPGRDDGHPSPAASPIVLAEDDYHAVAADIIGWTNREFHRLFDERRVLILGMSLGDPNLRRVLLPPPIRRPRLPIDHFAVMTALPDSDVDRLRSDYWHMRGVEVVRLEDHDTLLPFLTRLRYECSRSGTADLWQQGAQYYHRIDPWNEHRQRFASLLLADAKQRLMDDFEIANRAEIVEIGIFLLQGDGKTLELVFRGGTGVTPTAGERTFSAEPDRPAGTAGRVFVSGDLVRISREDSIFAWGIEPNSQPPSRNTYQGVVSMPIIDWLAGGIPIGTIYATVADIDGILFNLPGDPILGQGRSVGDLSVWLHKLATDLVASLVR